MSVALVTVPVARHSKTPTLAEWHEPRSSALMMTSLASAEYPNRWARFGSSIVRCDFLLELLHSGSQARISQRQDPHGEQAAVASPVDRHRGHWHALGHLGDGEQGVEAV